MIIPPFLHNCWELVTKHQSPRLVARTPGKCWPFPGTESPGEGEPTGPVPSQNQQGLCQAGSTSVGRSRS